MTMDLLIAVQLEEIKDILKRFGLDIKITHVNKAYCDDHMKHFYGIYEGKHLEFNFFTGGKIVYMDWYVEGLGSIRKENIHFNKTGVMESHGNMVYVGECS